MGVNVNKIQIANHIGQIENENVIRLHRKLLRDKQVDVRPSDSYKPNIQIVDSLRLSDGNVIISENGLFKKCMHSTTKPIDTENSKEISVGKNIDLTGIKPYASLKTNSGKATFHCKKCGKFIREK